MNHKSSIFKKISLFFVLLLFCSFVSAEVLLTTYPEKTELFPYELDILVVKILNNSENILDNLHLRIEGSDNIVFVEEGQEKKVLLRELTKIEPNVTKELRLKFKATSVKKEASALFVYYGFENDYQKGILPFVSGTIVITKENKVVVTTKIDKTTTSAGDEINGEISISNKTGGIITMLASEMIVPSGFDLKTAPFFTETISDSNTVSTKFNALAPLQVDGEQTVLIVYGYFDENGPHYFEKEHKVSFVKSNRAFLALIGIVVLIIAVFLYLQRTKKDDKLKGSGDKK